MLNCEETDMFTRDTVHKLVDSRRCSHSGSCRGDKCGSIISSSIIPELAEGNQYQGNTACVKSCGGPRCACFFPISRCLFHRIYLQPINNKTFEIFYCHRWVEAAKVEITHIDGIQRKARSLTTELMPNIPVKWKSFTFILSSISMPQFHYSIPDSFRRQTHCCLENQCNTCAQMF